MSGRDARAGGATHRVAAGSSRGRTAPGRPSWPAQARRDGVGRRVGRHDDHARLGRPRVAGVEGVDRPGERERVCPARSVVRRPPGRDVAHADDLGAAERRPGGAQRGQRVAGGLRKVAPLGEENRRATGRPPGSTAAATPMRQSRGPPRDPRGRVSACAREHRAGRPCVRVGRAPIAGRVLRREGWEAEVLGGLGLVTATPSAGQRAVVSLRGSPSPERSRSALVRTVQDGHDHRPPTSYQVGQDAPGGERGGARRSTDLTRGPTRSIGPASTRSACPRARGMA